MIFLIAFGRWVAEVVQAVLGDRPGVHDHVASWRGRCTYCGHRVGDVRQTREQPWRIPSEIVHRYLAMRQGRP